MFEWANNEKTFLSLVNAHQSVTLVKNDFNNEVDRITPSVDNSQYLCSALLLVASWPQSGLAGRSGG